MRPEQYKELLRLFDNDPQLIDDLLVSQQAVLRGAEKAHIAAFRQRFKAFAPSDGDDFLAGPSAWLQKTGGIGCL